jgi:hypothetical protein
VCVAHDSTASCLRAHTAYVVFEINETRRVYIYKETRREREHARAFQQRRTKGGREERNEVWMMDGERDKEIRGVVTLWCGEKEGGGT